jgi:Iron-containing redox enzyme
MQSQSATLSAVNNYDTVEKQFINFLNLENLDIKLDEEPSLVIDFENALSRAIVNAYEKNLGEESAHLFLQRILYRINRLNLFWYDDLAHYTNERSIYLQKWRNKIETAWQKWELAQIDVNELQQLSVEDSKQALRERYSIDVDPPLSPMCRYLREEMTEAGYCHLLAIASFDGLVEGSRLSRILGGAANEVQCTLVRVLLEEYGNGRYSRKHSTFFAHMLSEFGLSTEPEKYFDIVPWEVLAAANHNFLLTECKRYFLRYNGGLAYFEIAGPAAYRNYLAAAQRLGLSDAAMGYWELHIREDERHGIWMLEDVALPLASMYPNDAWQLVLGYEQEKLIGERAAKAVVHSIRESEQSNFLREKLQRARN